ncbi:hypothetical protein MASR1M60_19660 [Rhodocyclaceae bacterium]
MIKKIDYQLIRLYDAKLYLVTLLIDLDHFKNAYYAFPQARAVMDDFGTLVFIRRFS